MSEYPRVRPIVRIAAVGITALTAFALAMSFIAAVESTFARDWNSAGFMFVIVACMSVWSVLYGRLIALAAITGQDRTADFHGGDDDDDEASAAT